MKRVRTCAIINTSPIGIGWRINQESKDKSRTTIRFGDKILRERQWGYAQVKQDLWVIVFVVKADKDYL